MNATQALLAAILFVLVDHFHPEETKEAEIGFLCLAFIYGCYWFVSGYSSRKAARKQRQKDEKEFWIYWGKLEEIDNKYKDQRTYLGEYPPERQAERRNLERQYEDVLRRRNE